MKLVILETPFAGDRTANSVYLQECIRDCFSRGESPFASHRMYTTALDDDKPEERELGMQAGFAWMRKADSSVFYVDRGMSRGMLKGLGEAIDQRKRIEFRVLREENQEACDALIKLVAMYNKLEI